MTDHVAERELLPTASGRQTVRALGGLLRPHRGTAIGAGVLMLVGTVIGLAVAPLLGHLVDIVVQHKGTSAVTLPIVALAVVAVARGAAGALGAVLTARAGETVLAGLRERFVARALALPLETVERAGSGDLTARVTNDVSVVADTVRDAAPSLIQSTMTIAATFGGLAALDWRFLLVALLAVPIQLHTMRWYVRRAVPLYASQRVTEGERHQRLLDTVGAARTVRAFRLADEHQDTVRAASWAAVELKLRGVRLMTRFYGRLNLAEFVGLGAILVAGYFLVHADAVTVGATTAAALYFHSLFGPINSALALVDDAQSAAASLARIVGVADLAAPDDTPGTPPADASVRTTDLGHAYRPGHPVLHEVGLDIAPGERIAVVGASGAGKTTLAKLVAGIHTPTDGAVLLGGAPATTLSAAQVSGTVALVTQEVHVFAGTLADDLRLARPDATDADLHRVLDLVGALPWVRALDDGLDTRVGAGAHRLTTTQSQQLALARLLLTDPPVAILDEATAEAGSAGARALETAATAALDGRTALVVAHRLTQAAAADRIVVLDAGRVVQTGTHHELSTSDGPYGRLWAAWSATRPV